MSFTNSIENTKTELHTHLMGMLTFEGWIELLNKYHYKFPCDKDGNIIWENATHEISPDEVLINKDKYFKLFSIPQGNQVDYSKLNEFYTFRSLLIKSLINHTEYIFLIEGHKRFHPQLTTKDEIYLEYLQLSLLELIKQGIEYTEISFSNTDIISTILPLIDNRILNNIKVKFLLSTNRSNSVKNFRQSSRKLEQLLQIPNICAGFDIMGSETPFSDEELNTSTNKSFKRKLEIILTVLNKYPNTTLRIHSGETINSDYNTINTLQFIDQIVNENNLTIPCIEIRIGHGIHIDKNPNYLYLLNKYHCIVEINASSNFALNNIKKPTEIPYKYYLDNNIDVVLSSDGHGMYDTYSQLEDLKANLYINNDHQYKDIINTDNKILNNKTRNTSRGRN